MGEWVCDEGFFEFFNVLENFFEIEIVLLEEVEGIVCCGFNDMMVDFEVN